MTTESIIDEILRREGGYIDHPDDRGGCTKYGITVDTLGLWRGRTATCADVALLTKDEAREIYRVRYIQQPGFAAVRDDQLRALLIDWGVNSGPRTAIRELQRVLGVTVDGTLGPQTRAALDARASADVFRLLLQARLYFVADLVQRFPAQRVFAAGWMRRIGEFLA